MGATYSNDYDLARFCRNFYVMAIEKPRIPTIVDHRTIPFLIFELPLNLRISISIVILAAVSPLYAFEQSDLFGKLVVLILLGTSTLAWAIIVEKWLALRAAAHQIQNSWRDLRSAKDAEEALANRDRLKGPCAILLDAAVDGAARTRRQPTARIDQELQAKRPIVVNDSEIASIRVAMEGEHLRQTGILESRLGILSSIVSTAPFIGLLGTVWGVMMAFCGMAAQGKADINALAPGVSGALLTTVVALIVAIPALIGFNLLIGQVHRLTDESEQFLDEFVCRLKSQLSEERRDG